MKEITKDRLAYVGPPLFYVFVMFVILFFLVGCSDDLVSPEPELLPLCEVIETGDVYGGASNHQTGIWHGIAVDRNTIAEIGHFFNVYIDGEFANRFEVQYIDSVFSYDTKFLLDNETTAEVPDTWVNPTYELLDCGWHGLNMPTFEPIGEIHFKTFEVR